VNSKKPALCGLFADEIFLDGAGEVNRTPDLLITNQLLYQLSYTGEGRQV